MLNFIKKYFNVMTAVVTVARIIVKRIPHPAAKVATTVLSVILIVPTLKAIWDITNGKLSIDTSGILNTVATKVSSQHAMEFGFIPGTEDFNDYVMSSTQGFIDEDDGFTQSVTDKAMGVMKVLIVILLVLELRVLYPF